PCDEAIQSSFVTLDCFARARNDGESLFAITHVRHGEELLRRSKSSLLFVLWIASQELAMTGRVCSRSSMFVIARSSCDEAIQSSFVTLDCFARARNDGVSGSVSF